MDEKHISMVGADGRVADWTWSGNVYHETVRARSGVHSLKLFGNWSGPWNTSYCSDRGMRDNRRLA